MGGKPAKVKNVTESTIKRTLETIFEVHTDCSAQAIQNISYLQTNVNGDNRISNIDIDTKSRVTAECIAAADFSMVDDIDIEKIVTQEAEAVTEGLVAPGAETENLNRSVTELSTTIRSTIKNEAKAIGLSAVSVTQHNQEGDNIVDGVNVSISTEAFASLLSNSVANQESYAKVEELVSQTGKAESTGFDLGMVLTTTLIVAAIAGVGYLMMRSGGAMGGGDGEGRPMSPVLIASIMLLILAAFLYIRYGWYKFIDPTIAVIVVVAAIAALLILNPAAGSGLGQDPAPGSGLGQDPAPGSEWKPVPAPALGPKRKPVAMW